jgi:RNA polymerase sigma factor (TIGR02999 family)
MKEVSTLLRATTAGVQSAAEQLFELLYGELRAIASAQLHRNDHMGLLSTTTLVHESYLRFANTGELRPEDRTHFLAYASHVMRSIVVDTARRHLADKRGAGQAHVRLSTDLADTVTLSDEQTIRLHEALEDLSALEPRLGKVVEMRYFGGLQEEQIAEALAVSLRTVQRDWEKARLLLGMALKGS